MFATAQTGQRRCDLMIASTSCFGAGHLMNNERETKQRGGHSIQIIYAAAFAVALTVVVLLATNVWFDWLTAVPSK